MENKIVINEIKLINNRVEIFFETVGDCKKYFNSNIFFCEYEKNIENVDNSILVVPFVANILPILWLDNIKLYLDKIDKDFFDSVSDFKNGYEKMFPNFTFFSDVIIYNQLVKNEAKGDNNLCLFSGGVDAYNTLINVCDEHTQLFSVIGADIPLNKPVSIQVFKDNIKTASQVFNTQENYCYSNFRDFLNYKHLDKRVKESGDCYWHAFQHGIGIIALAAILSFINGVNKVYIASSYSVNEEKLLNKLTCASHPSIDNYVKFCGVSVEHNGIEFDRFDKIKNICQYAKNNNLSFNIHVCWENTSGKNCCKCEKCYRTLLAICAIGILDPNRLGFIVNKKVFKQFKSYIKYKSPVLEDYKIIFLQNIQSKIDKNSLYFNDLKWFKNYDLSKFNKSIKRRVYNFVKRGFRFIKRRILKIKN